MDATDLETMETDVVDSNKTDKSLSIKSISRLEGLESGGHLDQMFRQTRIHHAQLSQMADVKASMMLTLASLIITFSIGYLNDPVLRWPTISMICCCVVTIISAAYAVMPKLNLRTRQSVKDPDFNILFFGSFIHMDYQEFASIINEIAHDPTLTYEAQLREIYEIGIYLGRKKYRYIRIAYGAFLLGVVLSVFTLVITAIVNWFNAL